MSQPKPFTEALCAYVRGLSDEELCHLLYDLPPERYLSILDHVGGAVPTCRACDRRHWHGQCVVPQSQ